MRNEKFKFWHLQNFMKVKSYQPKTFFNRTRFLMEHAGLSKQLFGQCKMELNILFHLPNFMCVKRPIQKNVHHVQHISCKLIRKILYFRNYSTRKHSHKKRKENNKVPIKFLITISDLQFKQIKIQEDHNIHTYSLFDLVVLAEENLGNLKNWMLTHQAE